MNVAVSKITRSVGFFQRKITASNKPRVILDIIFKTGTRRSIFICTVRRQFLGQICVEVLYIFSVVNLWIVFIFNVSRYFLDSEGYRKTFFF